MTQPAEDREALIAWLTSRDKWPSQNDWKSVMGSTWISGAREGWQAVRDCYAPKLTEMEAVQRASHAVRQVFDLSLVGPDTGFKPEEVASAVLRAAGVRFKEEA